MRITADTNILVRAAVLDDPPQAALAADLLRDAHVIAVTLPALSVINSRAMAPVIRVSLPVFMAGNTIAWLEENADALTHPRPHCPQ